MRKSGIIILSSLLICFIIVLSLGLAFTAAPTQAKIVKMYVKANYEHRYFDLGKRYSMHTFTKDGLYVAIVWYANEELAQTGLEFFNKIKYGDRLVIKRGNAVAYGDEDAITIFQFA